MVIFPDVTTLDAATILVACGTIPAAIVGSPPCPAYSSANSRGRGLDDDPLFLDFVRLVGECRPVWCVAENSPNLRLRGGDRILTALEALGYAVWPLVVGAVHAGANHRRQRCWVVAADTKRVQLWDEPGRGGGAGREGAAEPGEPVADGTPPDLQRTGLALRQEQPPRDERAAAERGVRGFHPHCWDLREKRPLWQAGLPDLSLLDDGPPIDLAHYRAICAAQGDAIVPQVALPILRALRVAFPDATRVLDLFSGGVGGWAYACRWAGLDVVAACEADEWRRDVYRRAHHG